MLGLAIGKTPGTAMNFDQRRIRTLAPRPKDAGQKGFLAVAQIFDIINIVGCLGRTVSRIQNDSRHGEILP
jgi:hypothetical protein